MPELAAWLWEVEPRLREPVFRGLFAMAEQELGAPFPTGTGNDERRRYGSLDTIFPL